MTAQPQELDELEERRRIETEGRAAEQADEPGPAVGGDELGEPQHVSVDPLDLSSQLLIEAFTEMRGREARPGQSVPRAEKIALGQALATLAATAVARQQYAVTEHIAGLQLQDRERAIAHKAGPAGIVVPRLDVGSR